MKKILAVAALLSCALSISVSADGFFRPTEIYGSIGFGGLTSGFQNDLPNQTLSPTPDSLTALMPMLGVRTYLLGPLGIEASFVIFGSTSANTNGYDSLGMYSYSVANLGLILRAGFRTGRSSAIAVFAGGGANYSFLSLSSDYTSLFSGVIFYNVLSDIGYYAKAGIAWYPFPGFFMDISGWYYLINAKFDVSGKKLDGAYFLGAMSMGFAF